MRNPDKEPTLLENWLHVEPKPMSTPIDIKVWGVVYRITLIGVPADHPLHHIVYIGQAIRAGANSAQQAAEMRWKEEVQDAAKYDKKVGILWALDEFGESAFRFEVVEAKLAERAELQEWADEREIALIAECGGTLKDPDKKLKQTLNLDSGGQGKRGRMSHEAMEAVRFKLWNRFMKEMHLFVDGNLDRGCRVPRDYVTTAGYPLGVKLHTVKSRNDLIAGHPERAVELSALPMWGDGKWKGDTLNGMLLGIATKRQVALEREMYGNDFHSKRSKTNAAVEKKVYGDDIHKQRSLKASEAQRKTFGDKVFSKRTQTWVDSEKDRHGSDIFSTRTKKRIADHPEDFDAFRTASNALQHQRKTACLERALNQPPHPYQLKRKKRVPGDFYWMKDKKRIGRCLPSQRIEPLTCQPSLVSEAATSIGKYSLSDDE